MSDVNIDAYFERIGFAGSIAPTLETLQQLHALHVGAIPFENLDALMGVPVRLELKNLEQKLLYDRRGGYGPEINLLFKRLLEELDFKVKGVAARVFWNVPDGAEPQATHLALVVESNGSSYLADVGFGGMTLTTPIRLRTAMEQETSHGWFRLTGGGEEDWALETRIGEEWKLLYRFTLAEKSFEDIVTMSDMLAADPGFNTTLRAARIGRDRRLALRNARLTTRLIDGSVDVRMIASVEDAREVLANTFGIALPNNERLNPALEAALAKGGDA
ncbi:MAG TPA: arylamine N-acetyltransferase [Devosia sp.]